MSGDPVRVRRRAAASGAAPGERVLLVGLTLALLAVGAVSWLSYLRPSLQVEPSSLGALPLELGPWRGRDLAVDGEVERMLAADFNVQRAYVHSVGDLVWFYVGYYGTERGGKPEHTPWMCYPSNGWAIVRSDTVAWDGEDGRRANELVIEKDGEQRLVHFWYQSHRRTGMLGWFDQALDHFVGRLLDGRADGSLVRLSTPLDDPGDTAAARLRLVAFADAMAPELRRHWPAEAVAPPAPAP